MEATCFNMVLTIIKLISEKPQPLDIKDANIVLAITDNMAQCATPEQYDEFKALRDSRLTRGFY